MRSRPDTRSSGAPCVLPIAFVLLIAACDGGLLGTTNQKPVAVAGADVEAGVGEEVAFDGAGSSDPDGDVVEFHWAFGDGATAEDAGATHAYAAAGTFTATLTVTDDRGDKATDTRVVTVVVRNAAPVAEITATNEALEDTSIEFSGATSSDLDGSIVTYAWDFGGGATATGVTATHVFADPGTYTVTLTVTDDRGATGTAEAQLRIRAAPVTVPASSQWTWDVVNAADRPDSACGPFQAGPLTIQVSGTSITVTEGTGSGSVVYRGNYTASTRAFDVTNTGTLVTQSIHAAFDAQFQAFDGRYDVSASLAGCNRSGASGRPVHGDRQ